MKTVSAALSGVLYASNVQFRANVWDVYLAGLMSGTVLRLTDADTDIVVDGVTYPSSSAITSRGGSRTSLGMEVGSCDLVVNPPAATSSLGQAMPTNSLGSFALDALAGSLDGARVVGKKCFMATYGDCSTNGAVPDIDGVASVAEIGQTQLRIGVASRADLLTTPLPLRVIQPRCPYALYDLGCRVKRDGFKDGRVVAAGSTATTITANAGFAHASAGGIITFNNGPLRGLTRTIRTVGFTTAVMDVAFPKAPNTGDSFYAYAGCDKTRETCNVTFRNLINFGGFPDAPSALTRGG